MSKRRLMRIKRLNLAVHADQMDTGARGEAVDQAFGGKRGAERRLVEGQVSRSPTNSKPRRSCLLPQHLVDFVKLLAR